MAINLDIIGQKSEAVAFSFNQDTLILYALGIGAGVDELDFVYEKNLKVFPTFAVIPFMPALMVFVKDANINLYALLHGEQKIIMHQPIPVSGTVYSTAVCDAVFDKGDKGAVLHLTIESR